MKIKKQVTKWSPLGMIEKYVITKKGKKKYLVKNGNIVIRKK